MMMAMLRSERSLPKPILFECEVVRCFPHLPAEALEEAQSLHPRQHPEHPGALAKCFRIAREHGGAAAERECLVVLDECTQARVVGRERDLGSSWVASSDAST